MIPQRGNVHSSRLAQRRKKIFLIKLGLLGFFSLCLLVGAWFLLRDERVTIVRVYAEGNSAISTEELQSVVRDQIDGSYFYLVPKRNILFYPRKDIEAAIASAFPRLEKVEVSKHDLSGITVSVEEKHPFALWCGESYSAYDSGSCYFVDKGGLIFAKAPDFSGVVFRRYFGGGMGPEPVGKQVLTQEEFKTFQFFLDTLKREGFYITSVDFKDNKIVEGYFDNGGRIIFNLSQEFSRVIENLKLLLESSSFVDRDSNGRFSVDYIDLQSSNKIFYKPRKKDSKPVVAVHATSSATSTR